MPIKVVVMVALLGLVTIKGFAQTYRVGAKHFNEGYILGEILAQLLEDAGYDVERIFNLGGTVVCYEALQNGDIDVYPEYTGSLAEEILKSERRLTLEQLNERLQKELSLALSPAFGFNNTYALATTPPIADTYALSSISDLASAPALAAAFSYEFLKRQDGWEALSEAYQLQLNPTGIEHGLAYQAIAHGKIELIDVYATDGEIEKYDLAILKDDLAFFPNYDAVALFRTTIDVKAKAVFAKLAGAITADEMQAMNAAVLFEDKKFGEVAQSFLLAKHLIKASSKNRGRGSSFWAEIGRKTVTHLKITAASVGLAIAFGLPIGILLYIFSSLSRPVLYGVGLLQTVPSIALLALMIPLLGIGYMPAIIALFLYALLPILRNLVIGLTTVDPILKKVATGMGMTTIQRLIYVDIPLAMPAILAGMRTATIITIGTATLAAFIGAGGLGEFIVTGLALNNTSLILQGAVPAAVLAIAIELVFEVVEKILVPRHLRK